MVMEREILWKVSSLQGCGIFLPGVGWKPYEKRSFRGEIIKFLLPVYLSRPDQQQDAQLLGWEVAVCTLPYLPIHSFSI